ncbi:MAG: DUF6029 family protein [Fidelibacterota bacterium]
MRFLIFNFFLLSTLISQLNISGQTQLGLGKSKNSFDYTEHRLGLNLDWNQWNGWLEFEYAKPPELGRKFIGLRKFRLEYLNKNVTVKVGDIYEYWGRGLILNMIDDQSIDLDNGIKGGLFNWSDDSFGFEVLAGKQNIWRVSNQVPNFNDRVPNYKINNSIYGGRTMLSLEKLSGSLQLLNIVEDHLDPTLNTNKNINHQLMGFDINYFGNFFDLGIDYVKKDNNSYGIFSIVNLYIGSWAIGFAYKNYNFSKRSPFSRWDFVNNTTGATILQQMPTAFNEHSTTLLGKITHIMDYNDNLGFNLSLTKSIFNDALFSMNYSSSSRHSEWAIDESFNWKQYRSVKALPSNNALFNPFKEFIVEVNGQLFKNRLNYVTAIAVTQDVLDVFLNNYNLGDHTYSYESLEAVSFPNQFTYSLTDKYSIDIRYEYQEIKKGVQQRVASSTSDIFISNYLKDKQINRFISLGLARSPKWSINLAFDYSNTDERIVIDSKRDQNAIENIFNGLWDTSLTWASLAFSYNINSNNRVSFTYGSLRGGVHCSNGVCRYIQPFENGLKVSLISAF